MTITEPGKSRVAELLAVGFAAAFVWSVKWILWGLQPLSGDGQMYVSMARGEAGLPPWSFHILSPRLAGFLFPRNPIAGFFWIAAVSFVGASVAIDLMLHRVQLDLSKAERALGVALFMATCAGANMFRAYYLTDSLSYCLMAIACAAILYRRNVVVALATLAGIFNRETAAFVMPVWLVFNAGSYGFATIIRRFVIVFGGMAAAYLVLQYTSLILGFEPTHLNYLNVDNMLRLWRITLSWLGTDNVYYGLAICVFLAYGPVWFLTARGLHHALTRLRVTATHPLIALWALALPVAATLMIVDWRRGFQPLFPAVIASAVLGVRATTTGRPDYCWWLLATVTVLAAAATTDAWWFQPMRTPVIIGMAAWLAAVVVVITRPRVVVAGVP